MAAPVLSICIPTHQRRKFLAPLLNELLGQCRGDERIEICVSDNASTDGTDRLLHDLANAEPQVRFQINDFNQGAEENFLLVTGMAKGEFIWIFGSDDLPNPRSLELVLNAISRNDRPDIILWNREIMDINGHELPKEPPWISANFSGRILDLGTRDGHDYFSAANSLGCAFSFISTIQVRRTTWESTNGFDRQFIGSAYVHVAKLLKSSLNGARVLPMAEEIVRCRLGNDSFLELKGSIFKRNRIDFSGYSLVAEKCIKDRNLRKSFLGILTREHPNLDEIMQRANPSEAFAFVILIMRSGVPPLIALGSYWRIHWHPYIREPYYRFKHFIKIITYGILRKKITKITDQKSQASQIPNPK